MFKFGRTLVALDADDGGGGGEALPEPQSVAEAIAQQAKIGTPELVQSDVPLRPDGVPMGLEDDAEALAAHNAPVVKPEAAATAPVVEGSQVDPYAPFGGREKVEQAVGLQQFLATETGARALIAEGLTKLGKSTADVQAFMDGRLTLEQVQAAPEAPPWATLEDDDVLDGAQAKQYLDAIRAEALASAQTAAQTAQQQAIAAQIPLQEQVQHERQLRATQVTDGALIELLSSDGDPTTVDRDLAGLVLKEAGKYIEPNNWDSSHIRAAVIQGHNDVVKQAEIARTAYLRSKAAAAAAAPTTTGGAQSVGGTEMAEPKNLAEASKMAKEMGLLG